MLFCTCEPEEKAYCRKSCPSANGAENDAKYNLERWIEAILNYRRAMKAAKYADAAFWKEEATDKKRSVKFYLKYVGSFECRGFRTHASRFRQALRAQPLAA